MSTRPSKAGIIHLLKDYFSLEKGHLSAGWGRGGGGDDNLIDGSCPGYSSWTTVHWPRPASGLEAAAKLKTCGCLSKATFS